MARFTLDIHKEPEIDYDPRSLLSCISSGRGVMVFFGDSAVDQQRAVIHLTEAEAHALCSMLAKQLGLRGG